MIKCHQTVYLVDVQETGKRKLAMYCLTEKALIKVK